MDNLLNSKMQSALDKFKRSPSIKKAINWYSELPPRDAAIVKYLAITIALVLAFTWFIKPVHDNHKQAEAHLNSELKFHSKLKSNAYLFSGNIKSGASRGSILSTVNSLAKTKGIQLKRFEPEGKNGLRIWLEKVEFNSAIDWLELMETEKGISIEQISIDKVKPGIVNIRAVLKR